jgi:hypothetical protein
MTENAISLSNEVYIYFHEVSPTQGTANENINETFTNRPNKGRMLFSNRNKSTIATIYHFWSKTYGEYRDTSRVFQYKKRTITFSTPFISYINVATR